MHPQLNIAVNAARSAGRIISRSIEHINKIEISTKKNPNDYVTSIDRAAEQEIIKIIQKAYPAHTILGEESGELVGEEQNSEIVWIIDPLDGTMNFVRGIPHYAVSIAVTHKGILTHGVIYDPLRDELFTATKGSGAQLNGRRLRVSLTKKMELSLLATGFACKFQEKVDPEYLLIFNKVLTAVADIRRLGSAALDLAYVAAGRIDGFWETSLKPWDIAAGALLVREAGGLVSDFVAEQDFLQTGEIIAANPKIFPQLLKEIQAWN